MNLVTNIQRLQARKRIVNNPQPILAEITVLEKQLAIVNAEVTRARAANVLMVFVAALVGGGFGHDFFRTRNLNRDSCTEPSPTITARHDETQSRT